MWVIIWSANGLNTSIKRQISRLDFKKKLKCVLLHFKYKYTDWKQNNENIYHTN